MVPSINNACSDVFALGRNLVVAGSFLDVDGKLLVGSVQRRRVSISFLELEKLMDDPLTLCAPCHAR